MAIRSPGTTSLLCSTIRRSASPKSTGDLAGSSASKSPQGKSSPLRRSTRTMTTSRSPNTDPPESPSRKRAKVADTFDDDFSNFDEEAFIAAAEDVDNIIAASASAVAAAQKLSSRDLKTHIGTAPRDARNAHSSLASSSSLIPAATATATPAASSSAGSSSSQPQQRTLLHKPPTKPHITSYGEPGDPSSLEKHTMDPVWLARLNEEMKKDYFVSLKKFLHGERAAGKTIFPPAHLVHSWSRLTPLDEVKVVVVGQDPYHGPGQACGHSFSVPYGVAVPASLKNIYKELVTEYPGTFITPKHGNLDNWARQGVLLLNACLTVQAHQAGSHHNKGWEQFTRAVLKAVAERAAAGASTVPAAAVVPAERGNRNIASMFAKASGDGEKKKTLPAIAAALPNAGSPSSSPDQGAIGSASAPGTSDAQGKKLSKGVVFLVWGQPAAKMVAEAGITDRSPNILLLRSAHPSPLSAHRGFLGNGHFKRANEWLESEGRYGPEGGIEWGRL